MNIVAVSRLSPTQLADAARILRDAIHGDSYKALGEAEAEVTTFLEDPDRFALALLDGAELRGWIGGTRGYSHSLELHPLVVDPAYHRRGLGRLLVAALESQARDQRYLALHLGTDDDYGGTNLFGVDLFPNPLRALDQIEPTAVGHAFFFYRKLGFEPVGLLPHANGFGKPDIFMSKRLD